MKQFTGFINAMDGALENPHGILGSPILNDYHHHEYHDEGETIFMLSFNRHQMALDLNINVHPDYEEDLTFFLIDYQFQILDRMQRLLGRNINEILDKDPINWNYKVFLKEKFIRISVADFI